MDGGTGPDDSHRAGWAVGCERADRNFLHEWWNMVGKIGRASFVPPEPIRQLRDLTRHRSTLLAERSREVKRLEKELEDAGIKLSSVATDILGVSGRLMLQALINGERDPMVLAELAKARMRRRIPDLIEALVGNFGEHHAFLCRLHLQRIDQITATVEELSARISEAMAPCDQARCRHAKMGPW
jgi:transposase